MLVVVPVLILNAVTLAILLQGRTRAQFIVYLSSQEQLERYQPRDQVRIEFYAERIAGALPEATEESVTLLVDRPGQSPCDARKQISRSKTTVGSPRKCSETTARLFQPGKHS